MGISDCAYFTGYPTWLASITHHAILMCNYANVIIHVIEKKPGFRIKKSNQHRKEKCFFHVIILHSSSQPTSITHT